LVLFILPISRERDCPVISFIQSYWEMGCVDFMQTSLNAYIIKQLAKGVDEDDLIFEICETNQLGWKEVKALVEKIKLENDGSITSRQLPIKSVVAVATLVMGLTLVIVSTIFLVEVATIVTNFLNARDLDFERLSLLGDTNMLLIQVLMQESQTAIPFAAVALVNGLGMIFGSLLGMRETWSWLIDKLSTVLWKK
jgi:hypothetical protein